MALPADVRSQRIGVGAAALAAVSFGVAFPATAVALRTYTPLAAAGTYSTIALLVLVGLALIGVVPRPSPGFMRPAALGRLLVVALVGGLTFIVGMSVAVQLAGATVAGFVATLYAVFAALLAVPILGERLTPTALGAFILAIVGTALLADPGSIHGSLDGVLVALVAAVGFGLYLVLARKWSGTLGMGGTSMALAILVGRGPLILLIELIREPAALTPSGIDAATVLAMAYLAIVPSALAQVLIVVSTRRVSSRRTSAWLLLTPLTSAVLATVLLGEQATPTELLGGALVIAGILGASGAGEGIVRAMTGRRSPPAA